jgi:hypothetical protein
MTLDVDNPPVRDHVGAVERIRGRPIMVAGIAIIVAAIVAAAILIATSGSSSPKTASSSSGTSIGPLPATSSGATVQAASVATIRALPATLGHPVYWAGARAGTTYELTKSPDGRVYIRYLTGGAKVGSPRPDFITVGTYVVPNAVAAVRAAAQQPGAISVPVPGGGVGFYNSARPTSVYFAYPASNIQVETYAPSAAVARRLVESGVIKPVT